MKKIIFMMAAAVTFMAVGCTKENAEDKTPKKMITFSAGDESVKSVLDGKSVKWQKDDHIAIYDGTTFTTDEITRYNAHMFGYLSDYKFTYDPEEQNTSSNGVMDLTQTGAFYAVYPCLNDSGKNTDAFELTDDGAILTTFLASRQEPEPNTFATAANISACIPTVNAEDSELQGVMKNLCGYIKFSIETAENIAYVKFTSNSNHKMAGRCKVYFYNDGRIILDAEENKYVYCSATGGAMAKGTYYVAVAPDEHSKGINIMVTTVDGKVYEYNTGNITIVANQPLDFGAIDSKMSDGPTEKLSLLLDFAAGVTGLPTGKYDGETALTCGGYDVKVTRLYYSKGGDSYATWSSSSKDGYLKTPAIAGKVLKNVVVTFRGHTSNCLAKLRLWTLGADGKSDKKYSGVYELVMNPTGKTGDRYALPTMNSKYALRVSHVMEPNYVTNGQDEGSPDTDAPAVAANTTYMLCNESSKTSRVESIELIYEPAAE